MAITKLMREMAYAVLVEEDEAAALALADMLQETHPEGTRLYDPTPSSRVLTTDSSNMRAVLYLNCQITDVSDVERVQRDMRNWLDGKSSTGTLVWADVVRRMEVYEFPSTPPGGSHDE
jgi:hypothetical protein